MKRPFAPIPDNKLAAILEELAKEDRFVFLETTRGNDENYLSYLFLDPHEMLVCRKGDDPVSFLERAQQHLDQGRYVAGWLSYEFGYLLEPVLAGLIRPGVEIIASLGVYGHPFVYDHRS